MAYNYGTGYTSVHHQIPREDTELRSTSTYLRTLGRAWAKGLAANGSSGTVPDLSLCPEVPESYYVPWKPDCQLADSLHYTS